MSEPIVSKPWWRRMLVSGLDALPLTRVAPVELPEGHPDRDTFDTDLEVMRGVVDELCWRAECHNAELDGVDELFDHEAYGLLDVQLSIAAAEFDFTGDDIKAWKTAS